MNKVSASPIVSIVVLILTCFACTPQPETNRAAATLAPSPTPASTAAPLVLPDLTLIARSYPRVDGSTSTHPLQTLLACRILDVPCLWAPSPFKERRLAPDLRGGELSEKSAEIFRTIQHHGTHESYVNLIEGKTDLILVARLPSQDELQAAQLSRVGLDVHTIALDAFVFLVNAQNPVDSLSIENLRDIYAGKITDWAMLGGSHGQIKAYQRDRNSGSQELMEALVMKGTPMINAPDWILVTMMGPVNAIGQDSPGIGYSVFYYVTAMLPDERVKLIAINGIKPASETIATRAYPLTTEVYAVTRKGMPKESPAIMLRDWLFTDAGKAAIAASGYVPS